MTAATIVGAWPDRIDPLVILRDIDPDALDWSADVLGAMSRATVHRDLVVACILNPERWEPSRTAHDQPAIVLFRGDVRVALAITRLPFKVLHVQHASRLHHEPLARTRATASSGSGGSTAPTSVRDLKRRAVAEGLRIAPGTKHDRIIDPQRDGVVVTTVPSTPSDYRSLPNCWAEVQRYLRRWPRQAEAEDSA